MKKTMTIIILAVVGILGISIGFRAYNRILPIGLGIHKPVFQVKNIALDGYDVTSYFDDELVKGDPKFSTIYQKIKWFFSSEENLNEFKVDPNKFIPQFGGYCAKAASTGFAAPADPTIYAVYHDKLFIL